MAVHQNLVQTSACTRPGPDLGHLDLGYLDLEARRLRRTAKRIALRPVLAGDVGGALAIDHLLHGGVRSMQWKLRHDLALVVDRHVVAPRQLDQEARAVERQIEKHHVARADPSRRRASAPGRVVVEAHGEIVLIADLQRAPGLVADHDVAVAALLIDADPQHGAARIAADQEATEAEARVDANLPCADGPPQRRILRERGDDAKQLSPHASSNNLRNIIVPTAEITGGAC